MDIRIEKLKEVFFRERTKFKNRIVYVYSPYLWPIVSFGLNILARKRAQLVPGSKEIDSSVILVSNTGELDRSLEWGIDLVRAAESWLSFSLGFGPTPIVSNIKDVALGSSRTVLVITDEWFSTRNKWRGAFREVRQLAREARKREMKVWVLLCDTYDQGTLLPAAILVALCGGATILQTNTSEEANRFGLIFSSGPHIWTMPVANLRKFQADKTWLRRERRVMIASGGEKRREIFMERIERSLSARGWQVQGTNATFTWDTYVNLVRNSQIVVTACWVQHQFVVGSKRTKSRQSLTTTTHRVWEGWASGATVISNSTEVLKNLGFIAGIHYIELWDEKTQIEDIVLPPENELRRIAEAGHKHFSNVVWNNSVSK